MYICQHCDYSSSVKLGKCPSCGTFASFVFDESKKSTASAKTKREGQSLSATSPWSARPLSILTLSQGEMQRVLHQGIRQAGVYLLAGEPGIGKSTIMLQIIHEIHQNNQQASIAYFSAEEHGDHIVQRYQRLFTNQATLPFHVYHTNTVEDIIATVRDNNFAMIVVDSIQTITSNESDGAAGTPNQVRHTSEQVVQLAKSSNTAVCIVGHVTKWWEIAWPKYLEHIVDVVLYLEGERDGQLRFLRSKKNRFWPADDVAIFEMTLFGLQAVYDMKDRVVSQLSSTPGSVLSVAIDNGRPVLVQVEALLNQSYGKFPTRRAIGVDSKRLDLIVAILEKYSKLKLQYVDIYINIPGERYFKDSGLDLAIAAAIMSQYHNKQVDKDKVFLGEIALSGKVVSATNYSKRTKEFAQDFSIIDHTVLQHSVELQHHI